MDNVQLTMNVSAARTVFQYKSRSDTTIVHCQLSIESAEQGGFLAMNEFIYRRKSVRKFDPAPLPANALEDVRAQIGRVKPLYPQINYSISISDKTKGIFNVKAPHYLIFSSEETDGAPENIGFIGQQLDLFLSAAGIGSCWLGVAKPHKGDTASLPHMICMAFGKASEPLHREMLQFKRKPLSDISEGADARLEAARLAPSAVNGQNWYFIADNGKIHCYRKKLRPLQALVYSKMVAIDMGIAICHIAEETEDFRFVQEAGAPARKGYIYSGTVG